MTNVKCQNLNYFSKWKLPSARLATMQYASFMVHCLQYTKEQAGQPRGLENFVKLGFLLYKKIWETTHDYREIYFIVESSKKPKDGQKCRLSEKLFAARSSLGTRLSHLWSLTLIPKIFCYRLQLLYDCKGCPVLTKFSLTWSEVAKFALFE